MSVLSPHRLTPGLVLATKLLEQSRCQGRRIRHDARRPPRPNHRRHPRETGLKTRSLPFKHPSHKREPSSMEIKPLKRTSSLNPDDLSDKKARFLGQWTTSLSPNTMVRSSRSRSRPRRQKKRRTPCIRSLVSRAYRRMRGRSSCRSATAQLPAYEDTRLTLERVEVSQHCEFLSVYSFS